MAKRSGLPAGGGPSCEQNQFPVKPPLSPRPASPAVLARTHVRGAVTGRDATPSKVGSVGPTGRWAGRGATGASALAGPPCRGQTVDLAQSEVQVSGPQPLRVATDVFLATCGRALPVCLLHLFIYRLIYVLFNI